MLSLLVSPCLTRPPFFHLRLLVAVSLHRSIIILMLCAIHAITQLTRGPPKLRTRSTTVGRSMNVTCLHVRVPLCWTVHWIYLQTFFCTAIVTRV